MGTKTQIQTQPSIRLSIDDLSFPDLPPFPSNILTAPLHRLSLSKLRSDPDESDSLFSSCKDLGFFYLDLRGDDEGERLLAQADQLFQLGPKLYDLGREELSKYDYKKLGSYAGYKGYGSAVVDEKGNLDRNEFYNVCRHLFLLINTNHRLKQIRYRKMIS
jgi:isopenicillin N synthase-like dioxygenase